LGVAGLSAAGLLTIGAMLARGSGLTVVLLTLVYGAITFQQPGVFGVCLDIGQKHAGAITALMNTTAQLGAFLGSVAYGYIVERFHSYDAPFVPMAAILLSGALLWFKIDATQELQTEPERAAAPVNAALRG
jgi:predicted MFS family arabinose efflux permease